MRTHRNRLLAVSAATLALIVAGTAAVGAHPRDDDRGFRGERMRDRIETMRGAWGVDARIGAAAIRGDLEDFERREVTTQTADGIDARRVEQGIVESVGDDELTFSLGSGEVVAVVIDDDTQAVAFEEQEVTTRRGWSRTRLAPAEVETADIEVGTGVLIWSDSEDGADFVASRIVIQPPEADDTEAETEEAEDDVAAEEAEAAEGAAATDA
jgi:hypothetical protein